MIVLKPGLLKYATAWKVQHYRRLLATSEPWTKNVNWEVASLS